MTLSASKGQGPRVVVIGGGVGGLATAVHLGERGARVTLVEREPRHDAHSSGRSAEIQRAAIDDPVTRALALETAERLDPRWLEPIGLYIATGEGQPAWFADLERSGAAEQVDAGALPAQVGHARCAGEHRFWLPRAGRLRAAGLVVSLARAALRHGVSIQRSAGTAALSCASGRIDAVTLPHRDPLPCDAVVVAAGAWSSAIGAAVGAPLPLRCTTRHMVRIAGGRPPAAGTAIVWDDAAGTYLRPDGDGWAFSICDLLDTGVEVAGAGYPVDPELPGRALERFAAFAPDGARGARIVRAWTGFRDLSPDDRPVLGPDGRVPGLHWCAGLGGHGLTISLAAGQHAAEAVLGTPSALALRCAASRFSEAAGRVEAGT